MRLFDGMRPLTRDGAARDALAGDHARVDEHPASPGLHADRRARRSSPGSTRCCCPLVAFAVFGSSRHLVVAADSATAAIFASGLYPDGARGQRALHGAGRHRGAADRGAAAAGADFPARVPRRFPVADRAGRLSRRRRRPGRHRHAAGHDRISTWRASDGAAARRARARRRRRPRADGDACPARSSALILLGRRLHRGCRCRCSSSQSPRSPPATHGISPRAALPSSEPFPEACRRSVCPT